jgi:hypothetical protein
MPEYRANPGIGLMTIHLIAEFAMHDSRLRFWCLNHVHGGPINPKLPVAKPLILRVYFRGIADMTGLAAGSTRSRMTPIRTWAVMAYQVVGDGGRVCSAMSLGATCGGATFLVFSVVRRLGRSPHRRKQDW